MHLHLPRDHPTVPWTALIGMNLLNLNYWGANQVILQRALAAKSLRHAQIGLLVGGALKYIMLLIIVVPGIAMAALFSAYIAVRVLLNRKLAPPREEEHIPWQTRLGHVGHIVPILGLMVAVLGGIYSGVTTPTEAAAASDALVNCRAGSREAANASSMVWKLLLPLASSG